VSAEHITHKPESRSHCDSSAWVQTSFVVQLATHPESEHFSKSAKWLQPI